MERSSSSSSLFSHHPSSHTRYRRSYFSLTPPLEHPAYFSFLYTLTGKVYTSEEGNPLVIGGKGYDGTKTFATALAGDAVISTGESATFGPVFAPGAIRYEWTRGGVPLVETGDTVTLGWQRVKGDHTQEISVTPVYDVYGTEVKGEPSTATLTNEPLGMAILIR